MNFVMTADLKPPLAELKPHEVIVHDQTLQDEFFWLRERENEAVLDYLRRENAYTDAILKPQDELKEKLFLEMKGRMKETDLSVPVRMGSYFYYSRTEKDCQYPFYARKKESLEAPEELLLDLNALAKGYDYFSLGIVKVSRDHRYLAYAFDREGSEEYVLAIKDLSTGLLLKDSIPKLSRSLEWSADGRYFFYVVLDAAKRPYRLFRHELGTPAASDPLIYEEENPVFNLGIGQTRDRRFFVLEMSNSTTSECHVLDTKDPLGAFTCIHPREKGLEYSIDHHESSFFIRTNLDAVNFRVMTAPETSPGKSFWREFLPYRAEVKTEQIDCFEKYLVLEERERGLVRMRVVALPNGQQHLIEFPETVYSVFSGQNPEFSQITFRLHYTSLVQPQTVYDYDLETRRFELLKQSEVVGGYDAALYATERVFARSHDGVEVPLSLVYRRDVPKDGKRPFLLYGYGSYGICLDPEFSSNRLSLLDRGVVFALAHIRGGGDLGRPWYDDGKFLKKKNTFLDFIACAEHVIREGWTSPAYLAIAGGSAGGLLMGAVTNMRSDLFLAVVAKVPFVDVINTMLDESLPLTTGEYEEWGNPEDPVYFNYMLSYSPYNHVIQQAYPHMLITGGLYDPRVQYWEPAKWTARLRRRNTSDRLILLKMNMEAGHGGASGRYDYLKEIALEYSFLLRCWGLVESAACADKEVL